MGIVQNDFQGDRLLGIEEGQDLPIAEKGKPDSRAAGTYVVPSDLGKMAHPTRFERVTSAFGGLALKVFPGLLKFPRLCQAVGSAAQTVGWRFLGFD